MAVRDRRPRGVVTVPSIPLSDLRKQVGELRPTVEGLVIERGKIAEFARSIGCETSVFYDREAAVDAGYPDIPAPLTFTRTAYFPRALTEGVDPPQFGMDLGFDPERTVHGEQAYEYDRPIVAGDTLDATTGLTDVYTKSGSGGKILTFAELETVYTDADDERVLTERRTRIERGEPEEETSEDGGHNETGKDDTATDGGEDCRTTAGGHEPGVPEDLPVIGTTLPRFDVKAVSRRDIVRYLGASGDFNPLHYDDAFARRGGHESVVVPGMYVAGVASAALTDWVPLRCIRRFRTRFVSVVYPGNDLTVTGEATAVDHDASTVTVDFTVENAGRNVVVGAATLGR